ncbi:MAG: CDP-alcohol phosphatidyltransferase family protein [bacterium]|nr:CDP-alcohol phosphatidyltransferase family protein [bacterium]
MPQDRNQTTHTGRQITTGVLLVNGQQCFIELAGMPLWQRLILTGRKAGIDSWLVLAWHDTEKLREALSNEKRLQDIDCQVYSVADLSPTQLPDILPAEDVLIVAGGAIFDHHVLLKFQEQEGNMLGVTSTLTDATTRVVVEDSQVITLSSNLLSPYGSAGLLACCGTRLGHLLQQSWQSMQQTTTPFDVVLKQLINTPTVQAIDLTEQFWMPIAPPFATRVSAAEAALLKRLGRQGDSLIVRLVNRRLSQALSKRLVRTAVTPNQITLFSALLGLSGAFLLAQPTHLAQVLGSLLFLCSTIIDGCDGEVARLTFQESEFGGKLDVMMDNVVHLFLFPSIAIGLYRETHSTLILVLGGLTMGGVLISMAAYLPSLWRRSDNRKPHSRMHESLASRDFSYLLLLLALIDKLEWFLWITAVGTYLFAAAWFILSRIRRQQV